MTVSRATGWPFTWPVLARTSSAASGFFFCGMIEDPVEKLSDSRARASNCGVDQDDDLFRQPRQVGRRDCRDRQELQREIAIRDAVDRGCGSASRKPRARLPCVPVDGKAGAGWRGRAERAFVQTLDRIADARQVAPNDLDIGHAMAEGHRLRGLQDG